MKTCFGLPLAVAGLLLFLLSACVSPPPESDSAAQIAAPLRVGITPDYPPLVFQANQAVFTPERDLRGIEIDLARDLGAALGRPVEFVPLSWERQITALRSGDIDIIMSGMTITAERMQTIAFSDTYLDIILAALVRADDYARFRASGNRIPPFTKVGVKAGTTGEAFVRQALPGVGILRLMDAVAAPPELTRFTIDAFVDDSPVILWMFAESGSDFRIIPLPSTKQPLGWGMRKTDRELLAAVNDQLAIWQANGHLRQVLEQWLGSEYQQLIE